LQKWILGRGSYSVIQNQIRPYRIDHKPSIWRSAASYVILFLVFVFPLSGEVATSFLKNSSAGFTAANLTLGNYSLAFASDNGVFPFGPALLESLKLSIATAVTVTILGIGLGYVINQRRRLGTRFLYVLTMSTLAIPGIVLAAGYIFAWNAPYLIPFGLNFYGTILCVYLAYVSGALPNSIRLQMAALTQLSPSLLQAGQVQGAKTLFIFRKIVVPLIAATTISVLFLTFSHVMFELPSSELLTPAGQSVLPVVITHFYNEGMIEIGSAITVMGIGVILMAYLLGQLIIVLYKRQRKSAWARFFKAHHSVTRQVELNTLEREPIL
jgi:iron(III) transport system permease protein